MNIVAFFVALTATAVSATWLLSNAGRTAAKLQVVPPNALANETILARFGAAIRPMESSARMLYALEPIMHYPSIPDIQERATLLQEFVQQGLVHAVASNNPDSSTVYLSAAPSSTSLYSIDCADINDIKCLKKVNVTATSPQGLDNPFVLLEPTEVANFALSKLSSGTLQASVGYPNGEPVLLLQFPA
ncbi:unnamed protein product [Aphanomyces euteiches]